MICAKINPVEPIESHVVTGIPQHLARNSVSLLHTPRRHLVSDRHAHEIILNNSDPADDIIAFERKIHIIRIPSCYRHMPKAVCPIFCEIISPPLRAAQAFLTASRADALEFCLSLLSVDQSAKPFDILEAPLMFRNIERIGSFDYSLAYTNDASKLIDIEWYLICDLIVNSAVRGYLTASVRWQHQIEPLGH